MAKLNPNYPNFHDVTSHLVGEKITISLKEKGVFRYVTSVGRTTFKEFRTTADREKAEVFSVGYSGNDKENGVVYLKSNQLDKNPYTHVFKANRILMNLFVLGTGPSSAGHTKIYLSNKGDGSAILEEAPAGQSSGSYWSFYRFTQFGNTGITLISIEKPTVLQPINLFNFHVHPPAVVRHPPMLSPCLIAEASLIWQLTGGFFLAMSIGPMAINGEVETGILGLIKLNKKAAAALEVFKEAATVVSNDKTAVFLLTAQFLVAVYEAGLLWQVLKLVLSEAGFWAAGKVLSKLLEIIFAPEAEAADLAVSFTKWAYDLEQDIVGYEAACKQQTVKEVKFEYAPGVSLLDAQKIAVQNNWKLATPAQVEAAFYHLGYDEYKFGLMSDGRYAVPVQYDHSNFKKGPNIGATGGGQGFFYTE